MGMGVAIVLSCLVAMATGQITWKPQKCTPANTTAARLPPPMPDTFQARLEASFQQRNWTFDFEEYYDYPNNRQVTHQRSKRFDVKIIQNLDNNEVFVINKMEGTCVSFDLTKLPDFVKGFLGKTTPDGKVHIFSSTDFLKLINKAQAYKGIKNIRGINCDWWSACFTSANVDTLSDGSFMTVEFYYNAKDQWTMPVSSLVDNKQYPVLIHVTGTFENPITGGSFDFDNYYNFLQFRPSIEVSPTIWQTDRGLVCENRRNSKPLPPLPDAFSFRMELVDKVNSQVHHVHEFFDNQQGLFRIDYASADDERTPMRRIHDFNTGIAYSINKYLGNCSVSKISAFEIDAAPVDSALNVRIRTAKEFFDFEGANYTYEGMRNMRTVPTDVWIARRNNWPAVLNTESTWEWYFTNKDYGIKGPDGFATVVPWRLELWDEDLKLNMATNFFDFQPNKQEVFEFDITPCYIGRKRQAFQFSLQGSYDDLIKPVGLRIFRYLTLVSIQGAAVITPIRISNLRFDNGQDDKGNEIVVVTFTMLDKAPIQGDVVDKASEVSIEQAAAGLQRYIDGGQLQVIVPDGSTVKTVVAKPYSYKSVIRDPGCKNNEKIVPQGAASLGVSTGVVAGVAIAVLVLGAMLGIVALWMVCFVRQKPNSIKEVRIVGAPNA